jgi:hypothetical protein
MMAITPSAMPTDNLPTTTLPREEEVAGFSIVFNVIYHKVTKFSLAFDGDDAHAVTFDAKPGKDRQDFVITPPRKARTVTVALLEWEKSGSANVVGVDNLWIKVKRSPEFGQKVVPLLSIGGLVKYPMGSGGVVLNELRLFGGSASAGGGPAVAHPEIAGPDKESQPANARKKQNIVATILRNMGAAFAAK